MGGARATCGAREQEWDGEPGAIMSEMGIFRPLNAGLAVK